MLQSVFIHVISQKFSFYLLPKKTHKIPHSTKSEAANVVKRIVGVSEVVNNIEVLPLSGFDGRIRYQVARTLTGREELMSLSLL